MPTQNVLQLRTTEIVTTITALLPNLLTILSQVPTLIIHHHLTSTVAVEILARAQGGHSNTITVSFMSSVLHDTEDLYRHALKYIQEKQNLDIG